MMDTLHWNLFWGITHGAGKNLSGGGLVSPKVENIKNEREIAIVQKMFSQRDPTAISI